MIKQLKSLAIGGLAALALSGCGKDEPRNNPEDFSKSKGVFLDMTYSSFGRELFISDIDNDGEADVLSYHDTARWVGKEFRSSVLGNEYVGNYLTNKETNFMTPEIRKAASETMRTDRELGKLVQKEAYRLSQQNYGRK